MFRYTFARAHFTFSTDQHKIYSSRGEGAGEVSELSLGGFILIPQMFPLRSGTYYNTHSNFENTREN